IWSAVEIALFCGADSFFAAGSAWNIAATRSERFKNGVEVFDDFVFAADHLAVAAFESPDATAGADVNVVNALRLELFCTASIVDVIGIAAVNEDVAGFEFGEELFDRSVDDRSRHHQPNRARLLQFLNKVIERSGTRCSLAG